MVFSPDGKSVAAGASYTGGKPDVVRLWDVARRQELPAHRTESAINSVAFSPDGKILALGGAAPAAPGEKGPGEIILWDVTTGQERAKPTGPPIGVYVAAFSPDGKTLAAGGMYNTVKLYDAATGKTRATFQWQGEYWISSLAFTP